VSTLSQTSIKLYAAAAGFTNPSLMSAIAMAESSGSTTVVNSIGCVGLWQINQPVWVKSHPTWTKAWLQDPAHNAAAAKVIYDSQGLNAWEAYTNGAYSKYYNGSTPLTAQQAGLVSTLTGGTQDLVGQAVNSGIPGADIASEAESAVTAVWGAGKWISTPYNWLRIAFVLGGGIITVVAINMAIEGTLLGKLTSGGASDAVTNVIPGGGLVKKAISAQKKSTTATGKAVDAQKKTVAKTATKMTKVDAA
jgi:hypothetical protein